jgi:hypothetical protein
MTNIVFSPTLQAPIALSNPTGTLTLASDISGSIHQANPIPFQGSLSLIGAAVRVALAMSANSGALSITGTTAVVVPRTVTPIAPIVGAITAAGLVPTVTVASGATPLTFPRIMLVGVGGDQGYGRSNGYPWTTAANGTSANTAIQTLGAYDIVIISGVFEGWDSSGTYDRDNLTKALGKTAATYTVTKNTARPTQVFYYEIMNATISGNPYAQWQTLVDANNWYLYESPGGVGTKAPAGGGQFFLNYSAAWPGNIGSAGAGSSICGTNYGTTSSGSPTGAQGPARTFGNYATIKLLSKSYTGDTRFSFNAQMGSPSAAGIFLDEAFVALDGAGTVPSSYLDGINLAPGSQQGGGFPGLDTVQPVMARGIHNMFDQMQTMLALVNPGKTYYNFANFGQYANKYQFGTTTLTCGLENTLHGGLLENSLGAGASSWECFQVGNPNTGNTTYASGWPNLLANYYQGMDFCQAPKLVGLGCKLPAIDGSQSASWPVGASQTPTAVTATAGQPPSAFECQLLRYGLCTALLDDGYFAAGVTGYDWSLARWYDEYGDDSLTQVNVKRGYLGTASSARPTSPTWNQGTLGVWSRQFSNGIAIVNPRGNGAQTVTLPQAYQALSGTQQPTVNNGAVVTTLTIPDGDGRILILTKFVPNGAYSLSGTIGDGQLVTLTGSGFGSQGPTLVAYANFQNATVGSLWNGVLEFGSATVSAGGFGYSYIVANSKVPYGKGLVMGLEPTRKSSNIAYGQQCFNFGTAKTEIFSCSSILFPSGNNYANLSGGKTYAAAQVKLQWFLNNPIFANYSADSYCSFFCQNYDYGLDYQSNHSAGVNPIEVTPTGFITPGYGHWATSTLGVNDGLINPYQDSVLRHYTWMQLNAPAGSGAGNILQTGFLNPGYKNATYNNNNIALVPSGASPNGFVQINHPGYVQNSSGTAAEAAQEFNFDTPSYFILGEIYMATGPGACARVEIGNASTYAACTQLALCTVESPSWWSSSQIQLRLRSGIFYATGISGNFLYVTNSNNVTTQVGRFS